MASKVKLPRTKSQNQLEATKSGRKSARLRNAGSREEDKDTLAFKVINADQTKLLHDVDDVDQLQDKLVEVLSLENYDTDLKTAATVDYYVSGLWWAKQSAFNVEQLSSFFTVLHLLLENVKGTDFIRQNLTSKSFPALKGFTCMTEKHFNLLDNLREYKKMLVGIGHDLPEVTGGLECFTVEQAQKITDYLHSSLLQHYKMYEFMFCHTQAEEIIGTDLLLEVAPPADLPWPPPLEEGVTEEVHSGFISTAPSTPASQSKGSDVGGDGKTTEPLVDGGEEASESPQPEAEADKHEDLLSQLSAEEVHTIMDEVFTEMLKGVKDDVASKLREKETAIINRINKIHRVSSATVSPTPK